VNPIAALVIAIVGGAVAAFAAALIFVGVGYGILWIYVFGDNSWPAWVDPTMNALLLIFALGVWLVVAWRIFKRLNDRPLAD
jgi:hypothetical protein